MKKLLYILLLCTSVCFAGFEVVEDESHIVAPDGTTVMKFYRDNTAAANNVYIDWTSGDLYLLGGPLDFANNNFGSVGNIDGSDIDITAGTGDYSSTGTMSVGALTATSGLFTDYIDISESSIPATPAANDMRLYAESIQGFPFLSFKDDGGMVRKLVRDSVILVYNDSGSTIADSRIVYASGSVSDVPTVALAKADSAATMPAIGVTIESIANGAFGRVMQVGLLENVNTLVYDPGDIFYVSAATAGLPTTTAPTYPNLRQEIGTVLADSATVGSIQIVARSVFNDALIDHGGLTGLDTGADHSYIDQDVTTTGTPTFVTVNGLTLDMPQQGPTCPVR
jgi:hypothetical protein